MTHRIAGGIDPPRWPVLRWIGSLGSDVSEEMRHRLGATIANSTHAIVCGSVNSICVTLVAYARLDHPVLLVIAALDLLSLLARLGVMHGRFARFAPDVVFACGLLWASLIAATTTVVGFSDDMPMFIIVVASALGSCAGIVSRNFAAMRYALIQVAIIDLSYKVPFALRNPDFAPLLALQGLLFVIVCIGIMRQQRATTVRAIAAEIESRKQSFADPLTGLLNRRGLDAQAREMLAGGMANALLCLDLDGFKSVNDRLGHVAGDDLLCQVADRLREQAPSGSAICRLGGDEFLLLTTCVGEEDAKALASRLIRRLMTPYPVAGSLSTIGVSIGIGLIPADATDLRQATLDADRALYRAKAAGKGCFRIAAQPGPLFGEMAG
ncbi:GGDEF domain-containing protein [Rhizobium straminoryzae]|uniref:GGDEF domain-containing protein n=1 Tax=Rhizobium straminoryzae TaxID=1387186 RepID=A0A549TDE9_9HYPH|nr:GGDEF domain-containing protein [Rhizobium straminoryzae]TRL40088.1 GGDEF domain-containing protein [Rhizobium straminoryzae]